MSTATLPQPDTNSQWVRKPPLGPLSAWTATQLGFRLSNFAVTHLGRAMTGILFHLPAPVNRDRRFDVAFVSYVKWAKNQAIPYTDGAWDVVPNLSTEVVSPNDEVDELQDKLADYFRAGVELVWVVYPAQQQVHVYQSRTQITVLTRADTLDGGTVAPGFRLPLAQLFTGPAPTTANGEAHPKN